MNEEIEYAEMLEIPVSTVNVVKKQRRRKQKTPDVEHNFSRGALGANDIDNANNVNASKSNNANAQNPLRDSVIAQVNDKLREEPQPQEITADAELFAESANSEGSIDFDSVPDRIDTVRLYSADVKHGFWNRKSRLEPQDYALEDDLGIEFEDDLEKEGGMYALNEETPPSKAMRITLATEFAAACALCGAIFLTNVFVPASAINTFFRAMSGNGQAASADNRAYTDFTLNSVVSELSDAELTLSPTGILTFTDECHVYPAANGKVKDVTQNADGTYCLTLAYSDTFTGAFNGLDRVYYTVGDDVRANVPVGFSDGDAEVQVTMYSKGELLNCFQLTEENCLAWVTK